MLRFQSNYSARAAPLSRPDPQARRGSRHGIAFPRARMISIQIKRHPQPIRLMDQRSMPGPGHQPLQNCPGPATANWRALSLAAALPLLRGCPRMRQKDSRPAMREISAIFRCNR